MSESDPKVVLTPHGAISADRVFERTQGCWNCKHRQIGEAVELLWSQHKATNMQRIRASGVYDKSQISLDAGAMSKVAAHTRKGIDNDTALEMVIREAVACDPRMELLDKCEVDVRAGVLGRCACPKGPVNAAGQPIPEVFIHAKFLCRNWSGAVGASLAREGQKADLLPEELREQVDGTEPDKE